MHAEQSSERSPGRPHVQSVSVGRVREQDFTGLGRSAIDKRPVTGPVRVTPTGLVGDEIGDVVHHGGIDQAVYAYSREELDWWEAELGQELRDGEFAENLTTRGIDVDAAEVGERWRIGSTLLEVCSVRIPCNDFKGWMGRNGHPTRGWVKRFTQRGRPGPYLRVLETGFLQAGDPIEVVHRPGHGVTVATMFAALTTQRELLPELLVVEGLVEEARQAAASYSGQAAAK